MKETKFDQKAFDAEKAKLDKAMAKLKKKIVKTQLTREHFHT